MSKAKPRMNRIKMKVGLRVKSLLPSGEEGEVIFVHDHNPSNPIEEHGTVELRVTNPCKSTYLRVGDSEHYTEYNWDKFLKVIP